MTWTIPRTIPLRTLPTTPQTILFMLRVHVLLLKIAMLYLLLLQAALLPQTHLLQHKSLLVPPEVVRVELQVDCPVCPDFLPLVLLTLTEVVRAELQVNRPVCPDFLSLMLPLVQTLSLEAHVLLLLLETLLGASLGPLRLLDVAVQVVFAV